MNRNENQKYRFTIKMYCDAFICIQLSTYVQLKSKQITYIFISVYNQFLLEVSNISKIIMPLQLGNFLNGNFTFILQTNASKNVLYSRTDAPSYFTNI